ncbi:outer membrane beta-barrel protein [Pedobacter sp. UBA5917]|jgi:hypothetical protein|uniref:outer membrane beta-barrel protein n=1 Tax=Pedobacter sp. UBA5917 TaxID=1947061 RepID=UPI0025F6B122|nr:outer membrane beta-barrel protein [Pedobacter sp. UBA5917]
MKILNRKLFKALLFFIGLSQLVFAQQEKINSKILDGNTGLSLTHVLVKIRLLTDTAINYSSLTDETGTISFAKIRKGDYELKIHAMGYTDTLIRFSIPEGKFKALPPIVYLQPNNGIQLKDVIIKDNTPPVRMKGDTVEYNATKFKTKENAVAEDLLRKLPGVSIDKSGAIKAQGETVERILVDGKEFFGSDPTVATRNLPADMIQRVQVLDKKSDMEEFTGVKDGQKVKTINLITKKNMKRGYFGNANAGLGNNGHYEGGTNINSFLNETQASLILKGNDINKSGFSPTELIKLLSQNRDALSSLPPAALSELLRMKGVSLQGSSDAIAALVRPVGITDTKYGGVNFNNDWGDRLKLRSSYFFNHNNTTENFDYLRQYLVQAPYSYLQAGDRNTINASQRIDMSIDTRLSKRLSVKISPKVNLSTAKNNSNTVFSSVRTGDNAGKINDGTQFLNISTNNDLFSGNAMFKYQFAKKSRTMVLDLKPEYFGNRSNYLNHFTNNIYAAPGNTMESIDQQTLNTGNVYSINGNLVFTEPLSKNLFLQAGQRFYLSDGKYLRTVSNKEAGTGRYDLTDDRLSDNFSSGRREYNTKVSLSGGYKKLNYTISSLWKQSTVKGHSILKSYEVDKSYQAFLPSLFAELRLSKQQKLTLNYSTETNLPSVSDLQPLEDNSDPLFIRKGNPELDQEKTQNISFGFNAFKPTTGNTLYANLQIMRYSKQIVSNTIINVATGKQLIIPVNLKGNYNVSLNAGNSFKVDNDGSSLTAEFNAGYAKNGIMNNGILNDVRVFSLTPQLTFNYYLGNRISLGLKGSAAWNSRKFSMASQLPEKNWLLNYGAESVVILPFNSTLEASVDVLSALGLSNGYNNNVVLLNTGLSRMLGKQFSLKAEAMDLLNRNQAINRISNSGYIEDRKNNALGRYFQFSAIYKFRHFPRSK